MTSINVLFVAVLSINMGARAGRVEDLRIMPDEPAETVTGRVDVIDLLRKGEVEFNISPAVTPHDDPRSIFTVDGCGQLVVSGRGMGYMSTKRSFKDYRLAVEFRWLGASMGPRVGLGRDSGILVHARGPHGCVGSAWPVCLESNITEGGMGDFWVLSGTGADGQPLTTRISCEVTDDRIGAIWTPGASVRTFTKGRVSWLRRDTDWGDASSSCNGNLDPDRPVGEWNRMEVVAKGDRIYVIVNDRLVNEAFGVNPCEGHVCLQTECAPMAVRRLELLPLFVGSGKFEQ